MTTDADIIAALYVLNRATAERARRLALAVHLTRIGLGKATVRRHIRERFGVGFSEAWRIVDMAADMAGKPL